MTEGTITSPPPAARALHRLGFLLPVMVFLIVATGLGIGLPTTLLLDREGNEGGRLLGPAEWDSPEMVAFLRDYLKRTSAEEQWEWPQLAKVDRGRLPLTGRYDVLAYEEIGR